MFHGTFLIISLPETDGSRIVLNWLFLLFLCFTFRIHCFVASITFNAWLHNINHFHFIQNINLESTLLFFNFIHKTWTYILITSMQLPNYVERVEKCAVSDSINLNVFLHFFSITTVASYTDMASIWIHASILSAPPLLPHTQTWHTTIGALAIQGSNWYKTIPFIQNA